MAASAPTRLGPYEIVSRLGKGGMGEVWRARDPRLNREVAIKISAQQFTDRFEREARAIAALNHSNICTLFDVGPNYLVMELIEGPTLAERIAQGPVPLEEALGIARQIADALEAAHEKGIVHRDLKPANIKIRPDGSVKVLDFGLAKATADEVEFGPDSPTMLSAAGMILGTAKKDGKGKIRRVYKWYATPFEFLRQLPGKRLKENRVTGNLRKCRSPCDYDSLSKQSKSERRSIPICYSPLQAHLWIRKRWPPESYRFSGLGETGTGCLV